MNSYPRTLGYVRRLSNKENVNVRDSIIIQFKFVQIAFGMESNTLSDPNSKLNRYVTECLKGLFKYATYKTIGVSLNFI